MNKIVVSAPGKLMLFGEHAVVYNRSCLVTAVSSRIKVSIERTNGDFKIEAPQVKDVRFVEETVRIFQNKFKVGNGLSIKTESDFSSKYGFGSSSAVTTATLKGLGELFNISFSKKDLFDLSYKITLSVQGIGSGFDIAAANYGGVLYFVTGGRVIEPLSIRSLPLAIGYTGIKADTPTLVRKVRAKMKKQENKIKGIFDEITQIVELSRKELVNKNWPAVGRLMNKNQSLLQKLGVSTSKLDKMCQEAVLAGAWGAKLSGAGGGDCMIALVSRKTKKAVEKAIENVGGEIIKVQTCAEGAKIELE